MMVKINCGILEGDLVRFLSEYVPSHIFTQRKSYDEYYVNNDSFECCNVDIDILRVISERFIVEVEWDVVVIRNS